MNPTTLGKKDIAVERVLYTKENEAFWPEAILKGFVSVQKSKAA